MKNKGPLKKALRILEPTFPHFPCMMSLYLVAIWTSTFASMYFFYDNLIMEIFCLQQPYSVSFEIWFMPSASFALLKFCYRPAEMCPRNGFFLHGMLCFSLSPLLYLQLADSSSTRFNIRCYFFLEIFPSSPYHRQFQTGLSLSPLWPSI